MDPFTIAALVAAIGGAGMQYKASSDAQDRQQREIAMSLDNQKKLQLQAEKKALDAANKYEAPERKAEQDAIAEELTTELVAPVSESQAIRSEAQTTQGRVSDDYTSGKAASDLATMKTAEQLARLLGKTSSASRLRMNEGIRLMDTGQAIDQLGSFSRGQAGADQIAINQAGQVDPGMVFAGSVLQGLGTAGLSAGGGNLTTAGAGAKYGTTGQQASMLAAQEAGMSTGGLWNAWGTAKDTGNRFMSAFK